MAKMILAAAIMMMVCLGVGPAHAITVQIFQCTGFQTGCTTPIGTVLGGNQVSTVPLAGTYGELSILSGSVALSQTTTVKSMRLSAVLKGGSTGGSFLIRMQTGPSEYGLQPGGKNYPNSLALDGSWIGGTAPQIKAVLTANLFNATYQSTVDQPSALPTVSVVFSGNLFSRLQNTKTESIYLPLPATPSDATTCLDPAGLSVTTCNRNRHRKDLFITIRANQTINMGETVVTATSEQDVANGGRAEVNRFLLCAAEGKQFQMGTTSAEKNYFMLAHSPLATDPSRPNAAPPTFPIQFEPFLAAKDGSETLVSIPSDTDPSNDSQFTLFLPCEPVTFGNLSLLRATFATFQSAEGSPGAPLDDCQGTLRWVIVVEDPKQVATTIEVLYGRVTENFNGCGQYSGVNLLATGDARFLVDGDLKTRNQLNALNKNVVKSIKLDLDGRRAVGGAPIDIIAVLSGQPALQVNNDTYAFPQQSQVKYCPPVSPDHGFAIQITNLDSPEPPRVIHQERVSVNGCKVSANADTRVDFYGPGLYQIDVLNNLTAQDGSGFIFFNQ